MKKGPGNREVGRTVKWGETLWHETEFRLLGSEMAQRGKALASKHSNLFDPVDPGSGMRINVSKLSSGLFM